jgi:hypothetical protein
LPAIVAAGSGLAAGSAAALELGELQLQSTLGQPLRASIAYALSPNEMIDARCIAVRPAGSDLPEVRNATVRILKGVISITGTSPVMEPMLSVNVVVDCPYSAHVSRNYVMFVDPQERATPVVRRPVAAAVPTRAATPAATPVAQDSRYRVQPGDSLSGIVGRLEGLDVPSAIAIAAILDANPGAFIGGNPDKLKAGSWLEIPPFADSAGTAVATAPEGTPATPAEASGEVSRAADMTTVADSYHGAETLEPDAKKQIPATEYLPDVPETGVSASGEPATMPAAATETVVEEADAEVDYSAAYADFVAGDVVIDEPGATDTAPAESAVAPARIVRPSAGTRIVGTPDPAGFSWNWLVWAAVALISAFGAYLMFWPKLRERFGSQPIGAEEQVSPRPEPAVSITVPESEMTVHETKPTYDNVDFDLSDDSPTEENFAVDADLIDGTGFSESGDVDVNRDFGFAGTLVLDMELPEARDTADAIPETDIIPPPERPEDFIVSSEVLPEDDDEYDISMVVDATKMPDPAEVTECDLKAVPVDDTGHTQVSDDYTIVDELSLQILERDYEEELNATQMLNVEIEKAASALVETIGEHEPTAVASLDEDDPTAIASLDDDTDDNAGRIVGFEDDTSIEMQLTDLSELDLTATLQAQNDDDGDDPDLAATLETDDKTVEMPRDRDGARAR